jgi:hypothetical protein
MKVYEIVRNKKCFSVRNKKTKRIFSKCTTKKKALAQTRLLRAIWFPKNKTRKNGGKTKEKIEKKY